MCCTTCGKPARTQAEQDLHRRYTGHAEFVEKVGDEAQPAAPLPDVAPAFLTLVRWMPCVCRSRMAAWTRRCR